MRNRMKHGERLGRPSSDGRVPKAAAASESLGTEAAPESPGAKATAASFDVATAPMHSDAAAVAPADPGTAAVPGIADLESLPDDERIALDEQVLMATGETPAEEQATVAEADRVLGGKVAPWIILVIVAVVVAGFFISFALGKYALTPAQIVEGVRVHFTTGPYDLASDQTDRVLFNLRGPRILVVMLVGAALSMAGASYQGMFRNPLTSPDLLGSSAGASLGACLALLLDLNIWYVELFAFLGGMIAVGLAVLLNRFVDYDPTLGLVLAGILVSTLFQAGTSLIKFMADANDKLPEITFWLMGSFHDIDQTDFFICIVPMLIGFALLISQSWKLNVLSFGDEEARALGVNTRRTRVVTIFAATLITSVSVSIAGIIGWVGLVIPHLARALVGPNYKQLLPTSMLIGAVFLLIVDDVARLAASVEIPIGILTAILGVPFFVVIFRHNMKGWR